MEGCGSSTSGGNAHAEGLGTAAGGHNAHAEGNVTRANGFSSHAEGWDTTASGQCAHAEGLRAKAIANRECHAEGIDTTASGDWSHAEGRSVTASGTDSHAQNTHTIASSYGQTAMGQYNVEYNVGPMGVSSYLIVGNGTEQARSNAFRVHSDGAVFGESSYRSSGADYAEYFEVLDGNPGNEDMRGYFVTLSGDKIKKATAKDAYILGVVSAHPVVIGNADPDNWNKRFFKDEFGCYIMETITEKIMVDVDEHGRETYADVERESYVINPDFDESKDADYVPRNKRPEWQPVGLMGQLIVRDDGTCKADGCCKVADGGIATASEDGWRVIDRINSHLIKIIFK